MEYCCFRNIGTSNIEKSHRKAKLTPLTQIYDNALSCTGTETRIRSGGVKLLYWHTPKAETLCQWQSVSIYRVIRV
jgi:hypothetical protein